MKLFIEVGKKLEKFIKFVLLFLIKIYTVCLSPFFGGNCRFYPSCSVYAREVLQNFNSLKGIGLIAKRLAKCHPFGDSGYDPAPGTHNCKNEALQ